MEKNGFLDNLPVNGDFGLTKTKPKVENPDVVIYHINRCPRCGSPRVPVYRTEAPIRYHKCTDCKYLFKSVEK